MTRWSALVVALVLALSGCGGARQPEPVDGDGIQPGTSLREGGPSATVLRTASGEPRGVKVTWDAVEGAAGYNLYKSDAPIPDEARGSLALRVNAEPIPPSPAPEYSDIFALNLGTEWHYRVSTLDSSGDESELSPEAALTIVDFWVKKLVTTSARVGEEVVIEGEHFGEYDAEGDHVYFRGVEWYSLSFRPKTYEAEIVEWTPTQITCRVPLGTTRGPVSVWSNNHSADTPEAFENLDPYIESMTRSPVYPGDVITLSGNNFGLAQDETHYVLINDNQMSLGDYVSYTPTEIQFRTRLRSFSDLQSYTEVSVHNYAYDSNVGKYSLLNREPVAALVASPTSGGTQLLVQFDATGSSDPDLGDVLKYKWDFGDGTVYDNFADWDEFEYVYSRSGDYIATVTVQDIGGETSSASVDIHVDLSPMTVSNIGGVIPGQEFHEFELVPLGYSASGGEENYSADWFLVDPANGTETLLYSGYLVSGFSCDATTTVPDPTTAWIPLGTWQIRAQFHDSNPANDPDPQAIWPVDDSGEPGTFSVVPYDVLVVQDAEGDADSVESDLITSLLSDMLYNVTQRSSTGLELSELQDKDAVVWAADGPHGPLPYEWLSASDLALAKQYLDLGANRNLFILGTPAAPALEPFSQDMDFDDNYGVVERIGVLSPRQLTTYGLTNGDRYEMPPLQSSAAVGAIETTQFGTLRFQYQTWCSNDSSSYSWNSVVSAQESDWKFYFGMFTFSQTIPNWWTQAELLDNMIAGTCLY